MTIGFALCGSFCTYHQIFPVMEELAKVDFDALLEEAYATMTTETKLIFPEYK